MYHYTNITIPKIGIYSQGRRVEIELEVERGDNWDCVGEMLVMLL